MLQITFLGGAEEVGASCALVEIDGLRLLVDCGQRLGAAAGESLPDFSQLEFGPPISAVLITHAHADHIGALPAMEPFLPIGCPIFATEATYQLTKVMLQDSIRIMTRVRREDGGIPLFAPSLVPPVLERFVAVPWQKSIRVADGHEVFATWYPAGHILGAGMIEIRGKSGSILFSGDISVADQQSVVGLCLPKLKPNILVLESTYGGRMHAHRPAQERRLIERVVETHRSAGNVLFPTFALGRAQEILLIVGRAMREGRLPTMPIFADGLVRAISKIYKRLPDELTPWCRRLWEEGLDPIFPEDLPIRPIKNDRHRQQVIHGPPAVVIASSGMLQGGASAVYAQTWLRKKNNLIMVTGYQDEESPGQALLSLSAGDEDTPRFFKLAGVVTEVQCRVESCWLSAHADNGELVSFAAKLQPQLILPVHGDGNAREGLARSLMGALKSRVVLPANGGTYELATAELNQPTTTADRPNPLSFWPPWDPHKPRELDLARFHAWLTSADINIPSITLDELAELWRAPATVTGADWIELRSTIYSRPQPYFHPDIKRPYILHLTPPENLARRLQPDRFTVEAASLAIRESLPKSSGLARIGFYPEEGKVLLSFDFPRAAASRLERRLAELATLIGWRIELDFATCEVALKTLIVEILGEPDLGAIDICHQRLACWVDESLTSEIAGDLAEDFFRRTGYSLETGKR